MQMLGNGLDPVRQMFADQFEPSGNGFVYRRYTRDAPIEVSAQERDRYVTTFNQFIKYASRGATGGTVVLIGGIVAYSFQTGEDISLLALYVGLGLVFVAYMVVYFWVWNIPARELRGRGTAGAARSKAEMRQRALEKMNYGQIGAMLISAAALLIKVSRKEDIFTGWDRLWLVFGVFIAILAMVLAFRKWRFDSQRQ
jgi:hypothetical protein